MQAAVSLTALDRLIGYFAPGAGLRLCADRIHLARAISGARAGPAPAPMRTTWPTPR
jgi:hypothetical protein